MSQKLSAPKGLKVTGRDGAAVSEWEEVAGADGYKLFYYSADKPEKCIKTRYAQDCKKMILGFVNGREYLNSVCAFKYVGEKEVLGEMSEKVSFVPISDKLKAQNVLCLEAGETAQLVWECRNEVPKVTFVSDDTSVATVNEEGLVTAAGRGMAYITLTTQDKKTFRTRVEVGRSFGFEKSGAVLMFTGDLMCAVGQQRAMAERSYDFHDAFSAIKETLSQADLAAGVLETTCFDAAPFEHEQLRLSGGSPNCNSPSTFIAAIADAGFDALVTANNHNCDTGRRGLEATVAEIRANGMMNVGTLGDNPVIADVRGIKVGIIACTMISNGLDECFGTKGAATGVNPTGKYDRDYFVELINTAYAMGAEYIVAYQHWGSMNSTKVRRVQNEEARFMAEAGASLIVGSHPHACQRFSYIRTSDGRRVPCAYSLGNFLTTMSEMKENRDGVILRAELFRTEKGVSAKLSYIPCMSESRDCGAAVIPVFPPHDEESRESFARTKAILGVTINHFRYRPSVLLNGSALLGKIFAKSRAFRTDKTALLLSQISLGSARGAKASKSDEERLSIDIEKSFSDYIIKTKPDYVALDFLTAATVSCYMENGAEGAETRFFTGSKNFKLSEYYLANKELLSRVAPPYGEKVWKPLIKNYATALTTFIPAERIILFRHRFGERAAKSSELRTIVPKKNINRFIGELEDYFISLVKPAVVDLSDSYFTASGGTEFEDAYYGDCCRAAEEIASSGSRSCVSVPNEEIWFGRVMKYYRNMTARAYQSWLLDKESAADTLISQTSAEFAARNGARLLRLKKAGKSDLACVTDFFAGDHGAGELIRAANIIRTLQSGNLKKPYDYFEPAFREHWNILKTMVRLLSAEIGASVNESSVELVFLLRGKPQLKRYLASLNRMTVDIWGSCVSRESINRSHSAYIGKYIFKQAPILAFEPPIEADFPEGEEAFCGNRWRKRTIKDSFNRSGFSDIEGTNSRWILLDFYDLICKMSEYKGGLFETDDFICRTDFYKSIESECTECYLFEKRDMKYCFETITRFAKVISEKYGENIILIKAEPKNTCITLDYRTAPMEDDGMYEIKKKFISLCEERFSSVTGCYVIDISKHFYSSDSFPLGGAHIAHYEEEFYRQTGEYISEILCGTDRHIFSTVDDNYLLLRGLKLSRE